MYDSVNTWNKVCKKLGHDPKVLPDVSKLPESVAIFTLNSFKAKMIAEAFNKVDKENGEKGKPCYMPYFYRVSGGGFSFRYVCWYADVASRYAAAGLCFVTRNGAKEAAKLYVKIYEAIDQ